MVHHPRQTIYEGGPYYTKRSKCKKISSCIGVLYNQSSLMIYQYCHNQYIFFLKMIVTINYISLYYVTGQTPECCVL